MSEANKSLKRIHQILNQERSTSTAPERSLQPQNEAAEYFVAESLPPQKNQFPRGKRPLSILSRAVNNNQLIKKAFQLRKLSERVMGKLGLPYSAHIHLSTITPKGVALFHADSPSWLQRGRFLQQNLLDLLHQEGARQVTQVKLKVRFSNEPILPPRIQPKLPSTAIAHHLAEQAQQNNNSLQHALQRLSNTLLRKNRS